MHTDLQSDQLSEFCFPYSDEQGVEICVNFFLMYTLCITHLVSAALGLLFLNVHGQHLAAEREALSLLNHLLVRRYGVVPHDHMALEEWIIASQ